MKTFILILSTIILSTCSNSSKKIDISSLLEKELKVITIENNNVSELDLSLVFQKDEQRFNGFSGCNNFFGSYVLDGNSISFSNIGATKKYCPDASKNEKLYLNALAKITNYSPSENETIQLLDKNSNAIIILKY